MDLFAPQFSRLATELRTGLMSTSPQPFAGLKDFQGGLGSGRGALAADINLKIGTTLDYASLHAQATLLDVKAGLGGTEQSIFKLRKGAAFVPPVDIVVPNTTNTVGVNLTGGSAGWGGFHWLPTHGGRVAFGAYDSAIRGMAVENGGLVITQNGNAYDTTALMKFNVTSGLLVAESVPVFDFAAPANTRANQKALRLKVGTTDVFTVGQLGQGYFANGLQVLGSLTAAGVDLGTAGLRVVASSFQANFQSGWALADNADSESFRFLSTTTYAHAEASIATFRNSSVFTTPPVAKVKALGDFELTIAGKGVLLRSPDGTRYRVAVSNAGAVTVTAVP